MNKSDVIICIDMDDTIENLCEAWVDYLNSIHGTNVKYQNVKEWDMSAAFPTIKREDVYSVLHDTNLYDLIKPKKDAQKYIKKLIEEGFSVYICTNTLYSIAEYKFNNVLFNNFPYIDRQNIIITANKHLICCDFLIDDYEHNLMGNNAKNKILFDTPHNRAFNEKEHGMLRTRSWRTIYETIVSYFNEQNIIDKGRN